MKFKTKLEEYEHVQWLCLDKSHLIEDIQEVVKYLSKDSSYIGEMSYGNKPYYFDKWIKDILLNSLSAKIDTMYDELANLKNELGKIEEQEIID